MPPEGERVERLDNRRLTKAAGYAFPAHDRPRDLMPSRGPILSHVLRGYACVYGLGEAKGTWVRITRRVVLRA